MEISNPKAIVSNIAHFYVGKNIFITGATGFMGKVLVEKLLRDCSLLNCIYILVRSKKGVEPCQRHEEYVNHMVFDKIRNSQPEQLQKIRVVKGDVSIDGFGMDEKDEIELIDNVNIVFHCAANVRFDLKLKDAINFNTRGTHRMLKLSEKMKNLLVFVHVSTAYCQCNETVLEEKYYPAIENPYGLIQMSKFLKDDILDFITPKLLQGMPNTYAFSKGLSEDLVHSYKDKFSIVIARPTIVTAAWKEPFDGWIEGLNGPTGLMIAGARGVLRSMHCNPHYRSEAMPVDLTINACIAAAYKRSTMKTNDVFYCNISDSRSDQVSWGESIEMGKQMFYEHPLCMSLWYPSGNVKANYYHHLFCVIFFHYLPAYIIDFLLLITRQKPFLVNVQKRISQGLKVLQYYTTRDWIFKNENFRKMYEDMNEFDKETFYCDNTKIDAKQYIRDYIIGARTYLLKEKPENLPKAKANLKKLYYLDKCVTILFYGLILFLIYSYLGSFLHSIENVFEGTRELLFTRTN
ncbi:unnamed protein product [Diamesa serratosioi]